MAALKSLTWKRVNAKDLVGPRTFGWAELTTQQKSYIKSQLSAPAKASKIDAGIAAHLTDLKLHYESPLGPYVATDDAILYHEWLRYWPP